ncbi:ArsR family transcriptional regulator, virulence genes transcriptional regulator [Gammaproteobacteria bacterium]
MICATPLSSYSRFTDDSGQDSELSGYVEGDSELLEGDDDINRASRSLKAMSHPIRLKILCTLGDQEVSVQDIVDSVGTSQSNISQHLAILRDKGILASRKDANRVYYRVSDSRTLELIGLMRTVFCNQTY